MLLELEIDVLMDNVKNGVHWSCVVLGMVLLQMALFSLSLVSLE